VLFAKVFCGLKSGGFLITKEKAMPIDRQPPSMEEAAQRLAARIKLYGRRENTETIAPDAASTQSRARSARSRRHCHTPAEPKPRLPSPRLSGAYIPELAARLEDDRNLTDGARRCARKLAEYIYRRNREGRSAEITVTYLMRALGKCRRTVQRYLRQLEREGYIGVEVIHAGTRMCAGLLVKLLAPLLPRQGRKNWPQTRGNPDATQKSRKNRLRYKYALISRECWAVKCCNAIWEAYMKTIGSPPTALSLH
jgi:hypothetical protein